MRAKKFKLLKKLLFCAQKPTVHLCKRHADHTNLKTLLVDALRAQQKSKLTPTSPMGKSVLQP